MFILLINYVVLSYRRCKGTAVLGGEQTFCGLLPEVVATGAGICDKALMRRQNRVAKQSEKEIFFNPTYKISTKSLAISETYRIFATVIHLKFSNYKDR